MKKLRHGESLFTEDVKSLTDAPLSKTQKIQDWLTKVTEKSPLIDWMYHSPEESFDKLFKGTAYAEIDKYGETTWNTSDDVKELWKQAGKPRMKTHNLKGEMSGAGFFKPKGYKWDYGKRGLVAFYDKTFGSDEIRVGKGGGNLGRAVSELAHSIRFKDPKRYSKYETRNDLLMGKGNENTGGVVDQSLYGNKDTDEYQTHSVVEPKLRKWLKGNYGKSDEEYFKLMSE